MAATTLSILLAGTVLALLSQRASADHIEGATYTGSVPGVFSVTFTVQPDGHPSPITLVVSCFGSDPIILDDGLIFIDYTQPGHPFSVPVTGGDISIGGVKFGGWRLFEFSGSFPSPGEATGTWQFEQELLGISCSSSGSWHATVTEAPTSTPTATPTATATSTHTPTPTPTSTALPEHRGLGYWRNHSDQVAALLPIDLGIDGSDGGTTPASPSGDNDAVDTTAEARAILTSTRCNGANAIRCLAAQLLPALLNIKSGSLADHGCVDSSITTARHLLDDIGYAGAATAAQRQAALAIASALDSWNSTGC